MSVTTTTEIIYRAGHYNEAQVTEITHSLAAMIDAEVESIAFDNSTEEWNVELSTEISVANVDLEIGDYISGMRGVTAYTYDD